MRLGGVVITDFCNVNSFTYGTQLQYNQGTNARLWIQLVDLNQKIASDLSGTFYNRYFPPTGSALVIKLQSIDDANSISRPAIQADAADPSIWYIDLLPTDVIGSANIGLTLTEPGPITRAGIIIQGLQVFPSDPNGISFC